MQRLYLDCDGVILDTINKTYKMFEEKGINSTEERSKYYRNADWNEIIRISGEIDHASRKIKKLTKKYDVKILTHVYSKNEGLAKINYFKKKLPSVEVITVSKGAEKADMVDPKGSILVDDFSPNLKRWEDKGGIGIKFSNSGKKYPFITINNLLDLLDINITKDIKETIQK